MLSPPRGGLGVCSFENFHTADPFFRESSGTGFVDYYVHIKNAEIERFQAEVSDWEQREYFEMF